MSVARAVAAPLESGARPAPAPRQAPRAPATVTPLPGAASPVAERGGARGLGDRPTTRDRLRAALAPETAASPAQKTARNRLAASLSGAAGPAGAAGAAGEREATGARVVELSARRGPAPTPPGRAGEDPGGGDGAAEGPGAQVIPITRGAGQAGGQPAGRAAATRSPDRRTGPPGRGPPGGGPGEPTSASSAAPTVRAPSPTTAATPRGGAAVSTVPVGGRAPPGAAVSRGGSSTSPAARRPAPSTDTATDEEAATPAHVALTAPALVAFAGRADQVATRSAAHRSARFGARNAQEASAPDPQRDVGRQAATARVDDMARQEPGPFDASAFKAQVSEAVLAIAPPATLGAADRFRGSGRAGEATESIRTLVHGGARSSRHDIATATAAPLDRRGLEPRRGAEMVHDPPGRAATTAGASAVLPPPRPPDEIDLSAGPARVDTRLADRSLTVDQLAEAHEPGFRQALVARDEVVQHAGAGPERYRADESVVLPAAADRVGADERAGLTSMHGSRLGSLRGARSLKNRTRDDDQGRRDGVNRAVLSIHAKTKEAVEGLLGALDTEVAETFKQGESEARGLFEGFVGSKMDEYKRRRYDRIGGGALWLKDRLFDLPGEVNAFYREGRQIYLVLLGRTIDKIAARVSSALLFATLRIKLGRWQVRNLLRTLPDDLVALGRATAARLDTRFDLLTSDVEGAKDRLVDAVARSYVEATGRLDDRIAELKEQNKGLATRAVEFVEEVGDTVAELGRLLVRVLLKAASVVGDILAHPIRFFGNLVGAVGAGLKLFVSRAGRHLKEALLDLLFGHLGAAGITPPAALDFAGVFDLVCQVLRIRWVDIRARLVDRLGEGAVARMEEVAQVFRLLADGGVGAVWQLVRERLAELPDLVIGTLRRYVIERVVTEGIAYIASLLTPASAFIKACQGIYRIVSFIVEKARELAGFVDSVLDSIAAIAAGSVGDAAAKIDAALAGALKLAVGFLARLARLDSIATKVQAVIDRIRAPVRRAVDAVIEGAISLYQRTLGSGPEPGRDDAEPARPPVQEAADPHGIAMRVPVRMDHTQHTLSVTVSGGRPRVAMASERADYLRTMAASAMAREQRGANRAELVGWLRDIARKLEDLQWDWNAAHSKSDAEKRHIVSEWVHVLAETLQRIGREYGIDDLEHLGHASRYVEGNRLKPPYDKEIRGWFYPSGYLTATKAWKRAQLKELRHPTDPRRFLDRSSGTYEPEKDATIDHQPRVVEHWNADGRHETQSARRDYYNDVDEANLQLVARRHNSADGALAKSLGHLYKPEVGRRFGGPDDDEHHT